MIRLGLDIGTKTIILARRNDDNKITFRKEINGFYEFPSNDKITKNLLSKQSIPYIVKNNKIYGLGSKAEELANVFNSTLKRPMELGVVSQEEEAINIMASIIQAIIGKLEDDAILYYCIPADALNKQTNVQYHNKVAKMIIENYSRTDAKIRAESINEARAIAVGQQKELAIAISWGAGMVNVCYTMLGIPVFEFSLVGSGDWIDLECAKVFGYDPDNPERKSSQTPTTISRVKESIDLSQDLNSMDRVHQTIAHHYQILIENVVDGIINGFIKNEDQAKIDKPIPIIMAGGTSSPDGFVEYFKSILEEKKSNMPFEISDVTRVNRPLFAVSEGCLIASELDD